MTQSDRLPRIIQGGMGVGVSTWRLAKAVAETGNLGVVSGSMLDTVFVRRLQDGDPGGHLRRAMAHFPIRGIADDVIRRFLKIGGRAPDAPYKLLSMYKQRVSDSRQRITILANFVEVWLAKEGHAGVVGINLLTKVQMPNLASLYGAMLAGVDYVIMGAGIPREIPGVLDAYVEHRPARIRFDIDGLAPNEVEYLDFDPSSHWRSPTTSLRRPRFLAVVSAASLAMTLARKANGHVDGFIVEGPTAGGHNAPPRGELRLNERGEPQYGERDTVDLARMRELGRPFWLAGGVGSPDGLRDALAAGATGIQSGTLFAFAEESGLEPDLKARIIEAARAGDVTVFTDPKASPTGYPFKVVTAPGISDNPRRSRICDLGYLRTATRQADGRTTYRCPAEPVDTFVANGGVEADTVDRRCLCNGLTANIGQAQRRGMESEPPLVTSGDDLLLLPTFLDGRDSYSAADVVAYLDSCEERVYLPDTALRPVTSSA
jgi:NAD(P)H-dependent flavin oxidoreductase YrpB (nitropropane dioxygenase family)